MMTGGQNEQNIQNGYRPHHRMLWNAEHSSQMHGMHDSLNPNVHDHSSMNHGDHSPENHETMSSMGTIMYMDGFHSALFPPSSQPPPPCLNFLHPSWTLHTQTKFVGAMLGVLFMGILVEAFGVWRVKCLRKGKFLRREERRKIMANRHWQEQQQQQAHENQMMNSLISEITLDTARTATPNSTSTRAYHYLCPAFLRRCWRVVCPRFVRKICAKMCAPCFGRTGYGREALRKIRRYEFGAAMLHLLRALVGYLLMLAVMSYAVEFLVCTVVGIVLGRFLFVDMEGEAVDLVASTPGGENSGGAAASLQGVDMPPARGVMPSNGIDRTWGGGDPCCGMDDDEEDDNFEEAIREPLITTTTENLQNSGMSRRNHVGPVERL